MGRAPFQADGLIRCAEPVDDTDRRHWSAAFGSDNGSHQGAGSVAPVAQGVAEIGMHGNNPSASFLRGVVPQFDYNANFVLRAQNHWPGQVGDFSGPQPGFERQKDEDAVADGVAGSRNEKKELFYLLVG